MRFRDWIIDFEHQFDELYRLEDIPTDHIDLNIPEDFDEEEALEDCEENAHYAMSDLDLEPVYDDPDDDPSFDTPTAEEWEADNPRPKPTDFTADGYDSALEDWVAEYDEVKEEYESAVETWQKEQDYQRERNDEYEQEASSEWVRECLAEKRKEHKRDNDTIKYEFNHDEQLFKVEFEREDPDEVELGDQPIEDVYSVTFKGPDGYSTTKNMTGATAIYTQLFAAIKKLTQLTNVNGITFSPAEPSMALVYEKFTRRYLLQDFVMTSPGTFIKKEVVNHYVSRWPKYKQDTHQQDIARHMTATQEKLAEIRTNKIKMRSLVGKVVGVTNPEKNDGLKPGIITSFSAENPEWPILIVLDNGQLRSGMLPMQNVNLQYRPDIQTIQTLWQMAQQEYPHLVKGFKPPVLQKPQLPQVQPSPSFVPSSSFAT